MRAWSSAVSPTSTNTPTEARLDVRRDLVVEVCDEPFQPVTGAVVVDAGVGGFEVDAVGAVGQDRPVA